MSAFSSTFAPYPNKRRPIMRHPSTTCAPNQIYVSSKIISTAIICPPTVNLLGQKSNKRTIKSKPWNPPPCLPTFQINKRQDKQLRCLLLHASKKVHDLYTIPCSSFGKTATATVATVATCVVSLHFYLDSRHERN